MSNVQITQHMYQILKLHSVLKTFTCINANQECSCRELTLGSGWNNCMWSIKRILTSCGDFQAKLTYYFVCLIHCFILCMLVSKCIMTQSRNECFEYKNNRKSFDKHGCCFIVESVVSHDWRDSEERPRNSPHGPRSGTGWGKWFYQVVAKFRL